MRTYNIRSTPVGGKITHEPFTGTKKEARVQARWIARDQYPSARVTLSSDAVMAFDNNGNHLGDVSVEPSE